MAYSALPSHIAGDVFPIGDYDKIKGNFEASPIHQVTTKGDLGVATGSQTMARLAVGADDSELTPDASTPTGLAWQIKPAARVYNTLGLVLAADTWTTLTFDSEGVAGGYDTDGSHSTVTNTGRLTVPANGAGLYYIGGSVEFPADANPGGSWGLRILLNGVTVIAKLEDGLGQNAIFSHTISTDYSLIATDFLELQAKAADAVTINAVGNYSPYFWYHWFRRQ